LFSALVLPDVESDLVWTSVVMPFAQAVYFQ